MEALWQAVRAEDGRGQPTALAEMVPAHFGLTRPVEVTEAMYFNRIPVQRVGELSPIVFQAARGGDAVARTISDRQSDEVVAMAGSVIRRLDLADQDVDVVLGGGVFRNDYSMFLTRIERGLKGVATRARMVVLSAPPVVGAALLGLDRINGDSEASGRVRAELTHDRLTADTVEVGEP
jgi:N-acetylglucosamine kinase-like BadF-type ATPase